MKLDDFAPAIRAQLLKMMEAEIGVDLSLKTGTYDKAAEYVAQMKATREAIANILNGDSDE